MQALWTRQCKQDNRWLRAQVQSTDRAGIPAPVEHELVAWFRAPSKREQEKPRLRPDLQLSTEAMQVWQRLKAERKAAMEAQGQKFEAEDWWVERKEEEGGKKAKARDELSATMAILGVRGEEYVAENEEGNFVFVSPEGSVVGGEEEEEEEDDDDDDGEKKEEDEGGVGPSHVLAIRGPKPAEP